MNNLAGNRNDIWILTKNAREFPVNTKEQSRQPSGAVSSSFLSLSMIFSRYFALPRACDINLAIFHSSLSIELAYLDFFRYAVMHFTGFY